MNRHTTVPIVFRFRDLIAGNGFLSRVLVDGRALLTKEDDGDQWVYGVQPGAVAGGASDAATALNEFKARYESVLFDIAGEAVTFNDFEREVRAFFNGVNETDEEEWTNALREVRRTNASLEDLPTVKAESVPSRIEVALVDKVQPAMNALDQVARAA
jgi:hypothetical protein